MGEGDSLRFKANRTNSGKYWCLAENGFSTTVNASAFLNVQCKYLNNIEMLQVRKATLASGLLTESANEVLVNNYFPNWR